MVRFKLHTGSETQSFRVMCIYVFPSFEEYMCIARETKRLGGGGDGEEERKKNKLGK